MCHRKEKHKVFKSLWQIQGYSLSSLFYFVLLLLYLFFFIWGLCVCLVPYPPSLLILIWDELLSDGSFLLPGGGSGNRLILWLESLTLREGYKRGQKENHAIFWLARRGGPALSNTHTLTHSLSCETAVWRVCWPCWKIGKAYSDTAQMSTPRGWQKYSSCPE